MRVYGRVALLVASAAFAASEARAQVRLDVLHEFSYLTEGYAERALVQGADGNFYGTTSDGGGGPLKVCCGAMYRMTPDGTVTLLHTFAGGTDDGKYPSALLEAADGNFYGTTGGGGLFGRGTAFKTTRNGVITILHSFGGSLDGAGPSAALTQGRDGNFYGTTGGGGAFDRGTVFAMTLGGTVTVLHHFAGGSNDGAFPGARVVQATDGNFYGTTLRGGALDAGTIFRMRRDGTVTVLQSLYAFDGDYSYEPVPGLIQARDGQLYGMTVSGTKSGSLGNSTIYRMSLDGVFTVMHVFTFGEGNRPLARLLEATDGNFYGASGYALFKMAPDGTVTVLRGGFSMRDDFIQASDGLLYGTGGGPLGPNVVFRLDPGLMAPTRVAVGPGRGTGVTLSWSPIVAATSYVVKRGLQPGTETVLATGLTSTSYVDTTATNGQTHYYVVSAVNGSGAGADSYEVSFTPGRMVRGDLDGDARADLVVYRPSNGTWYARFSANNYSSSTTYQWGLPGDVPVAGDFDGDEKMDLCVYRPSTGTWYVRVSSSAYSDADWVSYQWGLPGDVPLGADVDGDGKTDLVVFRPSNGTWYIRFSSDSYSYNSWTSYQWGLPGDVPVAGDFDGDGKTDLAVYRPSNGTWYLRFSSNDYSYTTWTSYQWGLPGDVPVAGDFDGDGKADLAVYRPVSGTWYVRFSSNNYSSNAWTSYQWGLPGDVPVRADLDGDGRTDLTVYRPATGEWFTRYSASEYRYDGGTSIQWGLSADTPLPGS